MRILIALFAAFLLLPSLATAANEAKHPKQIVWPFDGMQGHFDRQSIQRGYQIYKEVCSACHAMKRVAFRNLQDVGFSEAEVKALAGSFTVQDGPNDAGEMFDRPGRADDHFTAPFPNEQASRAANGGAYPPDLSLIVKARHDGANYVYSILTGYGEPPANFELAEGKHYNPYFPGGQISMPPPLTSEGQVTYEDGTQASIDQMARDVVNFLQWAAEPEMEQRKFMGLKVMIFLGVMTVLFFFAKRRVWKNLH